MENFITAFEGKPDTLADYGAAVIAATVKNGDQGTAGIEQSLAAQGKRSRSPICFQIGLSPTTSTIPIWTAASIK